MATLPRCARCGSPFVPDRFNEYHQVYCTRPKCVKERKRERQRNAYRHRYATDAEFRAHEQQRCRESIRRRREASKNAQPPTRNTSQHFPLFLDAFTGLISHLADTTDQTLVSKLITRYADRGRHLEVQPMNRGSPL